MNDPIIVHMQWIPMTAALACALGYFGYIMWGKTRLLALAQQRREFWTHIPRRIASIFIYAFGQRKFFKEPAPGVMHAFIFWGFMLLQIRTLYLIALSFAPHVVLINQPIHDGYMFAKDIGEAIVLIMCAYALYRRLVLKPKRITLSFEATVVVLMIAGLMVTDFFFDGFNYAHAAATGLLDPANHSHLAHFIQSERSWTPVGSAISGMLTGLPVADLAAGREAFYWSHIFIVLTFLNMLPGSKHFHVITAIPNTFFSELKSPGALRPIEDIENQETFGVSQPLEFDLRQILDLYTCTECGRCTVNCPTTITGKSLNPKLLICDIRDHLYERERELIAHKGPSPDYDGPSLAEAITHDAIWDCTTCRACSEACPAMIEHVDKIVDLRRNLVLMEADMPKELASTLRNLETKGNPWGLPTGDRTAWAEGLDIPTLAENPDAEYVFWVGCAGAYDDQQKKVSRALVRILREANISFAILGDKETCSGDPARRAGNEYLFQILAQQNIEILKELGVDKKKIVTHCPHCFNAIKNEYPQFGGHFDIVHHSVLIDRLIAEGRLNPKTTPADMRRVTYHDSCYLGRYNDVYEPPRTALAAIPGIEIKEMARNRTTAMCCGAGGARVWMEETRGTRINQERVKQALETDPDTIVVACPFCKMMLDDGVKELGREGIQTKDIAELIAESLDADTTKTTKTTTTDASSSAG